jgi:hypothetical protein
VIGGQRKTGRLAAPGNPSNQTNLSLSALHGNGCQGQLSKVADRIVRREASGIIQKFPARREKILRGEFS